MRLAPVILLLAGLLLSAPVHAAPADYILEPAASTVGFETDFGQQDITGRFPITQANLTLDFDQAANSTIDVILDVSRATASFPFAADALKGSNVLDARNHPTIRFVSTRIRTQGDGATVQGDLTIRGVTKPVTLDAQIFRQQGYAEGDRSHLTVTLRGAVSRSAFGATGFADMVGDEVRLDIRARIARTD
jgi:polyisoprenoid-binding protein YceI